MMRRTHISAFVIAVMLVWSSAQASNRGFYGSIAAGGASNGSAAVSFEGTYRVSAMSFSARYLKAQEIVLGGWDASGPGESASDLAFLVGFASKYNKRASAAFELGPAYATIVRRVQSYYHVSVSQGNEWRTEREVKKTLGLALQCQMYFHRVAVVMMGDCNPSRGFFAVLLAFRIGKCT